MDDLDDFFSEADEVVNGLPQQSFRVTSMDGILKKGLLGRVEFSPVLMEMDENFNRLVLNMDADVKQQLARADLFTPEVASLQLCTGQSTSNTLFGKQLTRKEVVETLVATDKEEARRNLREYGYDITEYADLDNHKSVLDESRAIRSAFPSADVSTKIAYQSVPYADHFRKFKQLGNTEHSIKSGLKYRIKRGDKLPLGLLVDIKSSFYDCTEAGQQDVTIVPLTYRKIQAISGHLTDGRYVVWQTYMRRLRESDLISKVVGHQKQYPHDEEIVVLLHNTGDNRDLAIKMLDDYEILAITCNVDRNDQVLSNEIPTRPLDYPWDEMMETVAIHARWGIDKDAHQVSLRKRKNNNRFEVLHRVIEKTKTNHEALIERAMDSRMYTEQKCKLMLVAKPPLIMKDYNVDLDYFVNPDVVFATLDYVMVNIHGAERGFDKEDGWYWI